MQRPDRRKAPRETDSYHQTADRATQVIDEARRIRLQLSSSDLDIQVLRRLIKRQLTKRHIANRRFARHRSQGPR